MSLNLWTSHRNVRLRLGVNLANKFLLALMAPLMVLYLAQQFGNATAGLLLAVSVGVTMACTIGGGQLADRWGRRPTLLLTEAAVGLGYLGMALANTVTHSAAITFGCFLVATAASGMGLPANDAVMMDVATPELRTAIYTVNYWSLNLAFMVGGMLGGFLYKGHFAGLLVGGAVLTVGVFGVTALWLTETAVRDHEPPQHGWLRTLLRDYATAGKDMLFARLLIAAILITAVELQLTYYIGIRVADEMPRQALLHLGGWTFAPDGVELLGVLRTVNTLLVVVLALFAKKLFGWMSDMTRMVAGIAIFIVAFAVMAYSRDAWVLLAATVVLTVGELMNVPIRQTIMADIINPAMRAKYVALYALRPRAGQLIAAFSLVAATLLGPIGMAVAFLICGAVAIVLMLAPARQRHVRLAQFSQAEPALAKGTS